MLVWGKNPIKVHLTKLLLIEIIVATLFRCNTRCVRHVIQITKKILCLSVLTTSQQALFRS